MEGAPAAVHQLEAEMVTAAGGVQWLRRSWSAPIDVFGAPEAHRLELALLPRSRGACGCFPDRWGPHRFEPIGQLFLLPAGERVHAKSDCRDQSSIVCTLPPDAVRAWFDGELEWTDGRLLDSLDIANPAIRNLLHRLGDEIRHPGFATGVLAELVIAQIAIELARHCLGVGVPSRTGGLAPWRLRIIDDHLDGSGACPSLAELADLCGLSVRQMTRGFRVSRGRSIGSHIVDRRIDRAKHMLASGSCVKRIAHAMGFRSASNFSVAFRRTTGETPHQYRQRAARTGPLCRLSATH